MKTAPLRTRRCRRGEGDALNSGRRTAKAQRASLKELQERRSCSTDGLSRSSRLFSGRQDGTPTVSETKSELGGGFLGRGEGVGRG